MESLSRKPSSAGTFSNKNSYDDVFSTHRRKYAGASIDVQDYRDIFASSQSSSIPVLDLSTLRHPTDALSPNFRGPNPDYSKIFGGLRDEDVNISYEELFGRDKSRAPSSRAPTSQDSDNLSHQSLDALKQFNMSYNKINPKFKDGLDGTTKHVTQLPAVTGFTCFIDESVESISLDKKSKTFDVYHRNHPNRSKNSKSCNTDLDVNLDASASSAALKKAIEKAQESIRIAKESVGRKKNGLRSFSNKKIKNKLKVEDSSQIFQDAGRNHKYGEKLLVAKKFIDEIHEKISESAKDSKFADDTVVYKQDSADTETSKIQVLDFVHECRTDNMIKDVHEAEIMLENWSVVKELESEENDDEVRLSNAHELVEELSNLNVCQDFNQNDNEEQENVLEHEDNENAESVKHEEIEAAFEQVKSENESEHDKDDEIQKMLDGFCEIDAKDNVQTCDNKLEESEVNLYDDCEIKQEDNDGFDEKLLSDDDVMEETDNMNDISMETTQVVDDVTEVSCEFQADLCEKTLVDETESDDNEDEFEVKSEENNVIDNLADIGSDNDVQSESSSGNIQPPREEIPDNESVNELKDSREPESRQKEDEIEESGPSKVSGKDRFRRINEEAAAKEREWERNRLAVERAVREARERAFAEARERAERERAAVEKATEEVRQRMMAEAHEKVSKASVMNKSSSERTFAQSKIRAERAAVERATSEARQRALEKAISQKTVSDLNRTESALRTKAKLEKHNRIMERAAKALAEKEKRDRLAQKEQAERNRLAENLEADIKRWSNGKEGNLRALLSTLQYILGPESGWQPVSLTEIITSSAVKKAYRKATLCVHPDKLQQRGATIQHKYICEKVFDLLKAAWNRFNSEER